MFTGKVNRKGSVAIKTYLQKTLRWNHEWVRYSPVKKSSTDSKSGLYTGRKYDHLLRQYYEVKTNKHGRSKKKGEPPKCPPLDERMQMIIHHMEKTLKITIIDTQVAVGVDFGTHRIDTHVDFVGKIGGTYVVIELKCSEQTLEEHEKTYDLFCSKGKRLANLLPDTERVQHQLQTAFGVLGLRNRVPQGAAIIGKVIYSTTDAVRSYVCDEKFVNHTHFRVVPHGTKFPKHLDGVKAEFLKMPENPLHHGAILEAVNKVCKGFTEILTNVPCGGSFMAKKPNSSERVVVGILNDPRNNGSSTAKYARAREHMKQVAKKIDAIPMIVRYTAGTFIAHRIRKGEAKNQ